MRLFIPFATHVVQMEIRSSGEFRALTRQESGGGVSWHVKVLVGGRVKDAGRRRALGQMIPSAGRGTRVTGLNSSLSKHKKVSPPRSRGHFHPSFRIWPCRPDVEGR